MDHNNHDAIAKVIETIEALPSRVRVCPQWLFVTVGMLALIGGITGPLALWIATSQPRIVQEARQDVTVYEGWKANH